APGPSCCTSVGEGGSRASCPEVLGGDVLRAEQLSLHGAVPAAYGAETPDAWRALVARSAPDGVLGQAAVCPHLDPATADRAQPTGPRTHVLASPHVSSVTRKAQMSTTK